MSGPIWSLANVLFCYVLCLPYLTQEKKIYMTICQVSSGLLRVTCITDPAITADYKKSDLCSFLVPNPVVFSSTASNALLVWGGPFKASLRSLALEPSQPFLRYYRHAIWNDMPNWKPFGGSLHLQEMAEHVSTRKNLLFELYYCPHHSPFQNFNSS